MTTNRVIWEVAAMDADEAESLMLIDSLVNKRTPELCNQWLKHQAASLRLYADLLRRLLRVTAPSP